MMPPDRYVVVKGVAGFGDRTLTLGKAVEIARVSSRTLLIDWSDSAWNHDDKGFFHYFAFAPPGVRLICSDKEIRDKLIELSTETDIFPVGWRGQLTRTDLLYEASTNSLMLDGHNVQYTDAVAKSEARVIVIAAYCAGDERMVIPYLTFLTPYSPKTYDIAVHYRNTDKRNDITPFVKRVRELWKPGMSVYLATDDATALALFRAEFGADGSVPPVAAAGKGIHHTGSAELVAMGTTKEALNHDMIRDLLHMRDAVQIVRCRNSLFSRIVGALRSDLKNM
jgi:hypothetical protein